MINAQELLNNTVILSYHIKAWGNRRKADVAKIQTDTDKSRLNVTKKLIDSDEFKSIQKFNTEVREWLNSRSVPSFFRNALMLVKTDMVSEVDQYLKDAQEKLKVLVDNLVIAFPIHKESAKLALNGMFEDGDYPSTDVLRTLFDIQWNWIALNVAENLPDNIRAKENAKLQNLWQESIGEIIKGLRMGFKELVDHAVDRLTVTPGEKPKIFKDSLVPNFREFLDTFSARNVVNDDELETLVGQAKKLVEGISSDDLRNDVSLRSYTAEKFVELKKSVDEAVITSGRRFDFDDDDAVKKVA